MKASREKLLTQYASNPVAVWGVAIGGALLFSYFFLPTFFNGAKAAFSAVTDGVLEAISSIIGKPASQQLEQRSRTDQVTGLVSTGDRALSDLVDSPFDYLGQLIFGPK